MVTGSKAARRYATAFLQAAIEEDQLEKVLDDVGLIDQTLESSRDLKLFIRNPVIQTSKKRDVLREIFESAVQPLTWNFLLLLIQKGRENLLHEIMKSFVHFYHDYAEIQDVTLSSAFPVPDVQEKKLISVLEKALSKTVELETIIRPDLMGGVSVRIEDTVIDGTVKNKLNRLRLLFNEAEL